MQLECPHCRLTLDFQGARPSFCGYCGKPLSKGRSGTAEEVDQQATIPQAIVLDPGPPEAPSSLGGYRIVRRLGGGGMGSVYEAEASATGQRVAIKVIAPQVAASPVSVERFRQEGRLASLIIHPRCVFVMAADEEDGQPFIVMELMSGQTLQELVEKNGPLPIQDAVAKILDVIEGLQEAHRLGVVHRDVKPSNCFVLEDGRVKIGDFGLSKSLVGGMDLTKTGTFLGTLLYASPEQIKADRVDFRTDVYSVAATLYFLLAGRAPFQSTDAAATLARTIADPPTPLRSLRAEVPRALEKVILRGLERHPDRRWRSLADLHAALSRFVPRSLSFGAMGLRTVAFMVDGLLYLILGWLLMQFVDERNFEDREGVIWFLTSLFTISYLAFLEGFWGLTLGKWLLRLRVCGASGSDPPGFPRALWRSVLFYGITTLIPDLCSMAASASGEFTPLALLLGLIAFLWLPLGVLLVCSSMRAKNGYRGLHELGSGTRVVRLPWPRKRDVFRSRRPTRWHEQFVRDDSLPPTLGPFAVRGALHDSQQGHPVLAEDSALDRKVLIDCRPRAAQSIDAKRRSLHRPTRLRWLSGGQEGDISWDAFLAPVGAPLTDICDREHRLGWHAFRGILEQLADELTAACADDTLPVPLTLEQIWVQQDGRVIVLDAPLDAVAARASTPTLADPNERALQLLRQAARLALEGRGPDDGQPLRRIRAPVPEHAAEILQRLHGGRRGYRTVAELQEELKATQDRPAEVNLTLRAAQLFLLALALAFPLLGMVAGSVGLVLFRAKLDEPGRREPLPDEVAATMVIMLGFFLLTFWPFLWVAWAFAFRGGFTLHWMGLSVVRGDGTRASRLRCAWRALLVWLPFMVLLGTAIVVGALIREGYALAMVFVILAVAYLIACVILALCLPGRSLHDRLARTWLAPK